MPTGNAPPPTAAPDCYRCAHFRLTYALPHMYACAFFGLRSARLPSIAVRAASGRECHAFRPRAQSHPKETH
jgi:hypothetical protein